MSEAAILGFTAAAIGFGVPLLYLLLGQRAQSKQADTPDEDPRGLPCNDAGHLYGHPHRVRAHTMNRSGSRHIQWDVKIYLKRYYRCKKCDNLNMEKETIARFKVDTETGEVSRL